MNCDLQTVGLNEVVGRWKKEKVLGTGGFGTVVLWRNLDTDDTIALKQCRWGHDVSMTPKHRQRWTQEVEIMRRLNHPGVVKAFPVPAPLDVDKSELPLLAMEYCTGGDLRKVLCKPEHCCGLPEKQVRTLVQNIASAIFYLHSLRIIHRDLKPENIVLQEVNGEVRYKLIDLGYAKQLDHGSLCTSFVGTLQYLAPELFHSQTYTVTVDYWSLGLVTHEAMTGQRPFLPNLSPAQWIPIVSQKSSQDICVYLDNNGTPVFSKEITAHTHISQFFKKEMERWLQVMLEWHPRKRGMSNGKTGFDILDEILNKKVLHVFHVETAQVLQREIMGKMLGSDLRSWLEQETGIAVQNQIIVSNKGGFINDNEDVEEQCVYVVDDSQFCLFSRKLPNAISHSIPFHIPPAVGVILSDRMTPMEYETQKKAWMQSVFFCQWESQKVQRLLQAYRAYLLCLLSQNSQLHKATTRMTKEMNRFSAVMDMYRQSLTYDMTMYERQAKAKGITSESMFEQWKRNRDNISVLEKLDEKVGNLSTLVNNANGVILEIQRSPFAKSSYNSPLDEITKKVVAYYDRLKRRPKEYRSVKYNNVEVVQLLCEFMSRREELLRDIFTSFNKLIEASEEVAQLQPLLEKATDEICQSREEILVLQERRQKEIWFLMHALVKQVLTLRKGQSIRDNMLQGTYCASCGAKDGPSSGVQSASMTHEPTSGPSSIRHDGGEERFVRFPPASLKMEDDVRNYGCPASYPGCATRPSPRNDHEPRSLPYSLVFERFLEESYKQRTESESLVNDMKTLLDSLTNDRKGKILNTQEVKRP